MMGILDYFLFVILGGFAVAALVQTQDDQSGFISLDCGLPRNSNYTEKTTNITYISDADFTDTGISKDISPEFRTDNLLQQFWNVRSFPDGIRNCYRLNLRRGNQYLIRATFLYGNYDGQEQLPKFDLYLGPNLWGSVALQNVSTPVAMEIIHVISSNHLQICLVDTKTGTPFISALELRVLNNRTYTTTTGSLEHFLRLDTGVGFFLFIYSKPKRVEDLVDRKLDELDANALLDLLPDIPMWVKNPDYERVDWLNRFLSNMWPYIDKAACGIIRSTAQPIFADYIGKFQIASIEFDKLSLGTLPPMVHGMKVYETNERELVMEPAIRWAGNPNIVLVLKLLSLEITIQLVDLQICASPRIALKPLVPTFPCFASIVVSLMEKPYVDFGMEVLGGDIMSIPGLYHFVQETIKKQVAMLYLWPQTLEIPILDASTVAIKKPVGLLHVKVVRALRLLKKDILGTSDPYVKLSLTGERLPAKKTTIKKRNLNPEWNENFKLIVKEPQSQVLRLQVYDWDKVGGHDSLGMQLVPLKNLTPGETREFTLDLLKNTNINPRDKKERGQLVVELRYVPFKEDSMKSNEPLDRYGRKESGADKLSDDQVLSGAGLLSVIIQGAEDVEGERHNNPYALLLFRGEKKKTRMMRKTRDPRWNEEFQFTLEEPPLHEKICIEVMSKRTGFSFPSKESLGHVEINLSDVVHNGRINQKYHLINSKNGVIHVELRWTMV